MAEFYTTNNIQFIILIIENITINNLYSQMLPIPQLDRMSLNLENNTNQLHNQISSKFKFPSIKTNIKSQKRRSYTHEDHFSAENSPIKNTMIQSRWKLNQPYMQGYASFTKPDKQNNKKHINSIKTDPSNNQKQSPKNIFFTDIPCMERQRYLDHQDINSTIKKSKDIMKLIKVNRKKLIKLKFRDSINTSHSIIKSQKDSQPDKIYSYLNRRYVVNKEHVIDDDIINRYISTSPANKMQGIEQNGRKFLLQKMHSDYNKYELVEGYKKQKIKELIEIELLDKKRQFTFDYKNRYSIPYFSFLSLDREQKMNILERKSLFSANKISK